MQNGLIGIVPMFKGEKFNSNQWPKKWNWEEKNERDHICFCCGKLLIHSNLHSS